MSQIRYLEPTFTKDTLGYYSVQTAARASNSPLAMKINMTLLNSRQTLGIDELIKKVSDSIKVATIPVQNYLKEYLKELHAVVKDAESSAMAVYSDNVNIQKNFAPIGQPANKIETFTSSEIEQMVADEYQYRYETGMKTLNYANPVGAAIQQKYISQFNVNAKFK